jgi:Na+-transporting methylmalonyl-CoA/oxaloacetate decarboxylase gamma subunit
MLLTLLFQVHPAAIDTLTKAKIDQNAQRFNELDPWGVGMAFVGMSVVFLSLLLLYVLFYNLTRLLIIKRKSTLKKKGEPAGKIEKTGELTGEVNVAIATALHLYFNEIHDKESTVLTINRVARTYSPWSSKIYGLRQNPR